MRGIKAPAERMRRGTHRDKARASDDPIRAARKTLCAARKGHGAFAPHPPRMLRRQRAWGRMEMKTATDRMYRLTTAGKLALQAKRSVPGWYRTILAMIPGETPSSAICATLSAHPSKQVMAWLEQLETLGFVALVEAAVATARQSTKVFTEPVDEPVQRLWKDSTTTGFARSAL